MSQPKRKPLLNRKETQTLLTTLKVASAAGALSLTLAGWELLAQLDAHTTQATTGQTTTLVAALPNSDSKASSNRLLPTPMLAAQPVTRLNIVQWVQDVRGNSVAVVRDRRGTLWYVMGSDVPRIEQGLSPQVQPQPVQMVTRTRAS
jgi:hypothetical protein